MEAEIKTTLGGDDTKKGASSDVDGTSGEAPLALSKTLDFASSASRTLHLGFFSAFSADASPLGWFGVLPIEVAAIIFTKCCDVVSLLQLGDASKAMRLTLRNEGAVGIVLAPLPLRPFPSCLYIKFFKYPLNVYVICSIIGGGEEAT